MSKQQLQAKTAALRAQEYAIAHLSNAMNYFEQGASDWFVEHLINSADKAVEHYIKMAALAAQA